MEPGLRVLAVGPAVEPAGALGKASRRQGLKLEVLSSLRGKEAVWVATAEQEKEEVAVEVEKAALVRVARLRRNFWNSNPKS
jgi:hypothetical protein